MNTLTKLRNRLNMNTKNGSTVSNNPVANRRSMGSASPSRKISDISTQPEETRNISPDSATSTSNLVALAKTITQETEKLEKYIKESGSAAPSFDVDALLDFPKLPEDIKKARENVVKATKELGDLVTGPKESLRWMTWNVRSYRPRTCGVETDKSVVQRPTLASSREPLQDRYGTSLIFIYRNHKLTLPLTAKSFPLHETATYSQIAEKVGLDEVNVRRFMRHAMTNRIFREVNPDVVAHTAASRVLAEDDAMGDWVGFTTDDIFPVSETFMGLLYCDIIGDRSVGITPPLREGI